MNINKDSWFKEIVFGLEDGMVSTLGAITGIAIGSMDQNTIVLAGIVVITVESISMGVGSYLSNISVKEGQIKILDLEKISLKEDLGEEKSELLKIYLEQGWSDKLAKRMVEEAAKNERLLLNEMSSHEYGLEINNIYQKNNSHWGMFIAYIIGGLIPLSVYLIFNWQTAIWLSIILTLLSLFGLGVVIAGYNRTNRLTGGWRVFLLGGLAMIIGISAGWLSRKYLGN